MAYRYLVHGEEIPEELFGYFYRHVQVEENRPCLLAVLRYMGSRQQLTGGEMVFVDYNIHQLCEKNVVLGFFQNFIGKVSLPDRILKEQYVEYTADPASEVKIEYQYLQGDRQGELVTETMTDVFEGIRCRGFVLFQDEVLEYRIVEKTKSGEEHRTQKQQLSYQERMTASDGYNGYSMLNKMMLLEEQGETEQLFAQMKQYSQVRETARLLMKPL
jgi:hypothetical protein